MNKLSSEVQDAQFTFHKFVGIGAGELGMTPCEACGALERDPVHADKFRVSEAEDKNSAEGSKERRGIPSSESAIIPKLDAAPKMIFEFCPSCTGGLDTGFECLRCKRDWRPWATVYFDLKEVEESQ